MIPSISQLKSLKQNEILKLLMQPKGATFLTITAVTDARAKKTGNPYGVIFKLAKINGMVNFQYDNAIRKRLEAEGKNPDDFAFKASWHEPVIENNRITPISSHKETGELYLRMAVLNEIGEPRYFDVKGTEIPIQNIIKFLPEPTKYPNQGLNTPLIFNTFKLNNIRSISINGQTI